MSVSAACMAAAGLTLSFLPQELLQLTGSPSGLPLVLLAQACGALLLAFAMLNWMARANLIGGIYSRPVAVANFLHFGVVATALAKATLALGGPALWAVTAVYAGFAAAFGTVVFTHPLKSGRG